MVSKEMKENKKNLEGVSGWLLVFLIYFIFVTIGNFITMAGILIAPDKYLKIPETVNAGVFIWASFISSLVLFSFYLLTSIMILKKKKSSIVLSITMVWITVIISMIVSIMGYIIVSPGYSKEIDPQILKIISKRSIIIGTFIFQFFIKAGLSLVITLYFYLSKRVINTLKN